jgi:hypothetical protein
MTQKEMSKKYTRAELLEKLSDDVEEKYALCEEKILEIVKGNTKLVFSEKEKKELRSLEEKRDIFSSMAQGLEWYYAFAMSSNKEFGRDVKK